MLIAAPVFAGATEKANRTFGATFIFFGISPICGGI
jgi:hypothetical protein